jgi:hypothetical protein
VHLLYLDESGNPGGADDRHFVLAGISAFEQNSYFLAREVDAIKQRYFPTVPPLDFHASRIRAGLGFWRHVDKPTREAVLVDLGTVIGRSAGGVRLFGSVVEKSAILYGDGAVKIAMEQVCKRFDTMLKRQFSELDDPQRGLLVFAESSYQARAKIWVQGFRELGTQWGVLRNLSDIPYFVPAKESRLIQLADYVAHALYLLYEKKDASLAGPIIHRFDQKDGVMHGLMHESPGRGTACECPSCFSRRSPGQFGPWL